MIPAAVDRQEYIAPALRNRADGCNAAVHSLHQSLHIHTLAYRNCQLIIVVEEFDDDERAPGTSALPGVGIPMSYNHQQHPQCSEERTNERMERAAAQSVAPGGAASPVHFTYLLASLVSFQP
ncbi:hypothetical protein KQX54_007820 [Cotesia glomerata]|uniref:Uncharacterized protein n=1 Tax=Cotesia glomerata TaxID=32391 RepID=A0AAV7J3I9_COTGL|nr:hypothetical protein KQX54_007820 [Cotesia glomerata]